VNVEFGGQVLKLRPLVIRDGGHLFAPLELLDVLKVRWKMSEDGRKAVIETGTGRSEADISVIAGEKSVAMPRLLESIGAESFWDESRNTLTLFSQLKAVEYVDDSLRLCCSLPVKPTVRLWGNRLAVDLPGCKLRSPVKEVSVESDYVERVRLGQFDDNTTRAVLDLKSPAKWSFAEPPSHSDIVLRIGSKPAVSGVQAATPKPAPAPKPAADPPPPPFGVQDVRIERLSDEAFNIILSTEVEGKALLSIESKPAVITINLPGATLSETAVSADLQHNLIRKALVKQLSEDPPRARIEIGVSRPLAARLNVTGNQIKVSVSLPFGSGGKLSEKTIVVDPGHGGRESGARDGGVLEKDLNLKIAAEVAAQLRAAGAAVILTRESDVVVSLPARPQAAIDNNADFFISIHCNSNAAPGSASGIETYYHRRDISGMLLADSVHAAVCAHTGSIDRRVRSDTSLYSTGFAVLRGLQGTTIPGLLLECGYLNHSGDRARLGKPEFHKKIASGVVAGLKRYVEGGATD